MVRPLPHDGCTAKYNDITRWPDNYNDYSTTATKLLYLNCNYFITRWSDNCHMIVLSILNIIMIEDNCHPMFDRWLLYISQC